MEARRELVPWARNSLLTLSIRLLPSQLVVPRLGRARESGKERAGGRRFAFRARVALRSRSAGTGKEAVDLAQGVNDEAGENAVGDGSDFADG